MKKIFSIFLSLLVLMSSTGIAMTTHYCGGYAMDTEIALGHTLLSCGMEDMDTSKCPGEHTGSSVKKQNCCDDISLSSETDNHNLQLSKTFGPEALVALIVFLPDFFNVENNNQNDYREYSPPLLNQDIPVLHQSFLL